MVYLSPKCVVVEVNSAVLPASLNLTITMYCFYLILLVFSPSLLALPDQLSDDENYDYNWRLKENEPYRPIWGARKTRVEGYPRYIQTQNYVLSQMMSNRLPPGHGGMGLAGIDAGSEDDGMQGIDKYPPPRHRPHNKLAPQAGIPPSQMFTYQAVHRPIDQNIPQFAVPPSDRRFFETIEEMPTPSPENLNGEFPPAVEFKMKDSDSLIEGEDQNSATEESTEENNQVFKTLLIDFDSTKENIILMALVVGSSVAAVSGIALVIYGFIRLQRNAKAAADVEYPAYGVTGPNKEATPTGDRRLAHSAQMYHYQLTKQQIIAMESSTRGGDRRGSISEADSDDENEEGDYTVYECPGLAPTGEMEVANPLFHDEPTPATTGQNGQQPETTGSEPIQPTITTTTDSDTTTTVDSK